MKGIVAPKWVDTGERTKLLCDYDLQRDAIYSLKWYKDGKEIFRYVPTNNPQYKSFRSPGVLVQVNKKISTWSERAK